MLGPASEIGAGKFAKAPVPVAEDPPHPARVAVETVCMVFRKFIVSLPQSAERSGSSANLFKRAGGKAALLKESVQVANLSCGLHCNLIACGDYDDTKRANKLRLVKVASKLL